MKYDRPIALFVNPPAYDFSVHDFWLKPYGLVKLASLFERSGYSVLFFDFLDRLHPSADKRLRKKTKDGRGKIERVVVETPYIISGIPRRFKRYGLKQSVFEQFLKSIPEPDLVLFTCTMTYWYMGLIEAVTTVKERFKRSRLILGGNYADSLSEHAKSVCQIDEVVTHSMLDNFLKRYTQKGLIDLYYTLPLWERYYKELDYIVTRTTYGCPYRCTYCRMRESTFIKLDPDFCTQEIIRSLSFGKRRLIFYDDALLIDFYSHLLPIIKKVTSEFSNVSFYTPNGLHLKFLKKDVLKTLKRHGFKTLFIGLESLDDRFQKTTGSKLSVDQFEEFISAVDKSGWDKNDIVVYLFIGHPKMDIKKTINSINIVKSYNLKVSLSEFSPIPSTVDGDLVIKRYNLNDPLMTNRIWFVYHTLGEKTVEELKTLATQRHPLQGCHSRYNDHLLYS